MRLLDDGSRTRERMIQWRRFVLEVGRLDDCCCSSLNQPLTRGEERRDKCKERRESDANTFALEVLRWSLGGCSLVSPWWPSILDTSVPTLPPKETLLLRIRLQGRREVNLFLRFFFFLGELSHFLGMFSFHLFERVLWEREETTIVSRPPFRSFTVEQTRYSSFSFFSFSINSLSCFISFCISSTVFSLI